MSQRDTQFLQGFARLLERELSEADMQQLRDKTESGIIYSGREYSEKRQRIIARRAYDLVLYSQQFMPGIENIPDIQSWDDL